MSHATETKGTTMQHINHHDRNFIGHAAEVMSDRIAEDPDEYMPADDEAVNKMEALGNGGTALVITGDEIDAQDAENLMSQVIETEMGHWVSGSSPRLIWRTGIVLGFHIPDFIMHQGNPDCGPERINHALYPIWIARRYLIACATCGRLFP